MANLPANPGEALWIGPAAGKNHYNVGIGQGTSGGQNHTDFDQSLIEDGYTDANKFYLNSSGNVIFRINASAGRTSTNTAHPRSELRELTASGARAEWDGRSGTHYAKGRCRITEVTSNRPWICFAQIHGSSNSPISSDLIRLQTEGANGTSTNLSIVSRRSPVNGASEIRTVLRTGYDVGDWFSWEIRMVSGQLIVLLDGVEVLNVSGMAQNFNYFKAGCYLQDNVEKGASTSDWGAVEYERGSFVTWHSGQPSPTTPVFTGGTDPGGGPGGGSGGVADTAAPTVPENGVAVRGNAQLALSWDASTDNVAVANYNVYRFSASGSDDSANPGSPSGGTGGPLTDRTSVSYNNGTKTSTYHIYAADLDWAKPVGLLVYGDGSGEYGLANLSDTYLMAGTTGLIAVAKSHNMILVTPRAPGNGCTDGDGVCWYLGSNDGTTRAQKTQWLDDLIQTQVLALYDIDQTRVCIAGFSSGAENVMGTYGPLFAASWMEDGLLLAISYGSSPDQFGVTDTYTADFRANVAAVWDVRGGDETTALADSLEGYDWYVADGFATAERNVIPGGAHDRPGEFGSIVDQYVTQHVRAAGVAGGTSSTLGRSEGGTGETSSTADKMVASRHTAAASGTLTEGHFRAWLSASGSTTSKMMVYADSSSAPGALLATSDEITITSTVEGVRDYVFSGADRIAITAGTVYWVAAAWNDPGTPSLTFSRDVASSQRVESTATYGTPPNPFGTISATFTGPIDAWCEVVAGTGAGSGSGASSATLGKTSDGASSTSSSTDKIAVSSFTASANGVLTEGHARAWVTSESTETRVVVFANSGGAPGNCLAVSDELVISATSEGQRDYTFSGANRIDIVSGTTYWVGLAWDDPGTGSLTFSRDGTASARQETSTFTYPPTVGGAFGTPSAQTGPVDVWVVTEQASTLSGGWVLVASPTTTSYTDTGLTNGQTYTYAITAEDAVGNESNRSTSFSGVPGSPDAIPPTVPTGLAVTPGDGRVTLVWDASTDPAETGETSTGAPTGETTEFTESFELSGSTPFSRWNTVQNKFVDSESGATYNPSGRYSQTIVSLGAEHSTVLRTEVRDGDTAVGSSDERAEVSGFGKAAMLIDSGQERYYEFNIRFGDTSFSPTFGGGTNDWIIIFQVHQETADGAPPLALSMHSDGIVYLEREPDDTPTTDTPLWSPLPGVWHRVVMHLKASPSSSVGFVRIHVDDVEVLPRTACQTAYTSDPNNMYPKLGTYRRSTVGGTTVVYHDNFRISSPPEASSVDTYASGVLRYNIYIDGVIAAQVGAGETTATALVLVGLANGVQRSFTISAVDRALNESAQSAAVLATPTAPVIGGVALLPGRLTGGRVEVAIAWGADLSASQDSWAWTDITEDVRFDPGVSITLGRNDESSTSNPATLTLVLDNTSGDYSLGGRSARWPYVRRNTPVRVRIDPGDGSGGRIVLLAFADGFTPGWDSLRGDLPVVALSASGALRRLAQGDAPIMSAYRRVMAASSSVVAYWPMEEGESATYAPAVRGGSDFTFTGGEPDWAADDSFDCSAPLPRLSDAYFQADVNPYTNTGQSQVRFLLSIPDGGLADGTVLCHVSMTGTIHRWDVTYGINAEGVENLGLYRYNASDGSLHSSDIITFQTNGIPCRFGLDWTQQGSNILWTMSLTPATPGASATFFRRTLTGRTAGIVSHFELNPHNAKIDATIGHITVENAVTSFFANTDALTAHAGETATGAGGRLARLGTENALSIYFHGTGALLSDLDDMGPQLVAPLLNLLHECEASDQGQLWDGQGAGLSYTTRRRRELGDVALTIDAAADELADPFEPTHDDQRDRNRVTVTRLHGVTVTEEDATGPMGTGEIGIYDDAVTINNGNDSMASQYAHWFVALGTVEGYRYPSVTVDLAASPDLASAVLDVIPGRRIDVVNLDDTLAAFPDDSVSLIVEGIAHEITPRAWRVTFRCSLFDPWAVGEVAAESGDTSDMLLRLDTDGASVASAATAGATSLSVSSTGALWTTDADDYPLHLSVGGIKVRATACSGGTSPQTMTIDALPVARAAGLPVRLWSPRVIGLG